MHKEESRVRSKKEGIGQGEIKAKGKQIRE